jgi:hypothetical protein
MKSSYFLTKILLRENEGRGGGMFYRMRIRGGFNCGKAAYTQRGHGVMLGEDESSLLHGQLIGRGLIA